MSILGTRYRSDGCPKPSFTKVLVANGKVIEKYLSPLNNSAGTSSKIKKGKNGTQQIDSSFKNGEHELQNSTDKTKNNSN